MSHALQQIVIPVAVLGSQEDPETFTGWIDYLTGLLANMSAAMPCKNLARLSPDMAELMFGESLPSIDPSETEVQLAQSGLMRVLFDRTLAAGTIRLE